MLRRTYGRSRSQQSPSAQDQDSHERPSSPVYERNRRVTESTLKAQGPRTSRDRLLKRLSDGCFHTAYELDKEVPDVGRGEWVVVIAELIEFGYSFARRGNSLFMGRRKSYEKPQDVSELLAGIDASVDERLPSQRGRAVPAPRDTSSSADAEAPPPEVSGWDTEDVGDGLGEGFTGTAEPVIEGRDRLSLSEDTSCVLPARHHVTSTKAVLAKKRVGKTYMSMVVAEELLAKDLPFVVVDPTGVWWGLNATADGHPSDKPVLLLGGLYGKFPLTPKDGFKAADVVVSLWPIPVILDVSELLPEEQHEFVADFGARLYSINKRAIHLFIDECDEFAPQSPDQNDKHQKRCGGVIDRIVRRGGIKGIGTTLITQRPAVVHKNVLSQVDGIFVLQVIAPHDLEAVESWMRHTVSASDRSSCMQNLSRLGRGEAYYMQNVNDSAALIRFQVRPKRTFDSSKTPTVDDPEPFVPELASVSREVLLDVAKIFGHQDFDSDASDDGFEG